MCDQNFLGAPFAEHERRLFTVVRAGQDLRFRRVGLEIADHRQILELVRPVAQFERAVVVAAAQRCLHVDRRIAALGAGFNHVAADVAVDEPAEMIDLCLFVRQIGGLIRLDHRRVQADAALAVRREIGVLHFGAGLGKDREYLLHLALRKDPVRIDAVRIPLRHDRHGMPEGCRGIARERDCAAVHVFLAAVKVDVVVERNLPDDHGVKHVCPPRFLSKSNRTRDTSSGTVPR